MFKRAQKKEFGQALVEMAISMPVLILILSGLFDLGRVYYTYIALEEAGAEAALYLAVSPDCPTAADPDAVKAGNPCADPNNALYRASTAGNAEFVASEVKWNIPYNAAAAAAGFDDPFEECGGTGSPIGVGCIVVVQLSYTYEFITPGIEAIADSVTGGGLELFVQATQIVIFE